MMDNDHCLLLIIPQSAVLLERGARVLISINDRKAVGSGRSQRRGLHAHKRVFVARNSSRPPGLLF
jgi:hypothetical protein